MDCRSLQLELLDIHFHYPATNIRQYRIKGMATVHEPKENQSYYNTWQIKGGKND